MAFIVEAFFLIALLCITALYFLFIYKVFKYFFYIVFGFKNNIDKVLSIYLSVVVTFYLLSQVDLSCSDRSQINFEQFSLKGLKGKVAIQIPDSVVIFQKERVIIRIAKLDLDNKIFLRGLVKPTEKKLVSNPYTPEHLIIDTLNLSTIMRVNLRESSEDNKVEITRLNNNSQQVIDTTKYTEWAFNIKAVNYGKVNLVISISGTIKTDFGNREIDIPVYEKEVSVFATGRDKLRVFFNEYFWLPILLIIGTFRTIYKLIPDQIIIDYHMANSKKTNFWNAGAIGLLIYIITIISIVIFKFVEISLLYVPLVFIGTVLIYAVFTAVSLRDNEKLSEENFLKLMALSIKKLPPLNMIFKK